MKIFVFRDIRQINELITCKNSVSHQLKSESESDLFITCIRLQTELDKVFLPINHKNYNFQEKKNSQVIKEKKENLH